MKNFALSLTFTFFFMSLLFTDSLWEMDPLVIREKINEKIFETKAQICSVYKVNDIEIDDLNSIPLRLYYPSESKNFPVILMLHGGGWVAGNLNTHDNLARFLSSNTEALVVSVGYQNSPEAKFPTPFNECYRALRWAHQHIDEYAGNPDKIVVLGDSSGGNLAASICQYAKDHSGPPILAQVLINPATDLSDAGQRREENDALNSFRWMGHQYVPENENPFNPYISPLFAKSLHDLPQTLITVAEQDALREMGEKYAKRLDESGVQTTLYCQKGVGHLAGDGARASEKAKETLQEVANYLKLVFSKNEALFSNTESGKNVR